MSKAKKFALMGLGMGLMEGFDQLIQEAKSERLRQARLAEQQYLQAEQRAYNEKRDDELYKRGRTDKLADEERALETEESRYIRNRDDRREETAEERKFRMEQEDKRSAAQLEVARTYRTTTPPEGRYLVRVNGREREVSGSQLNELQDDPNNSVEVLAAPAGLKFGGDAPRSGRGPKKKEGDDPQPLIDPVSNAEEPPPPPRKFAADIPEASKPAPPRGAAAGVNKSGSRSSRSVNPGESRWNPIIVGPDTPEPPSSTWVKLPNGQVIQHF
jgi:hypothetical protein